MLNPARNSVALMFRKMLTLVLAYSFFVTSMWSLTQPGQRLPGGNSVSLASGKGLLPYLAFNSPLKGAMKPGNTTGGIHNDAASPAPIVYSNIDEPRAAQLDDDDHDQDGDRAYHHHSYHYDDDDDHHSPTIVATGFTFFGPQSYVRTTGQPNQFTSTFTVPAWITQPFFLHVENGDVEKNHRDSSATVALNDTTILGPSAFNEHVGSIDCSVNLATQSTLHVTLASKPGSFLKISVLGKNGDHTPPTLAVTAPLPGSSVNTTTPHLAVSYNDLRGTGEPAASGVNTGTLAILLDGVDRTNFFTKRPTDASADLPSSLALAAGPHTLAASIKDNAGNVAQATAQFQVDSAPLSVQIVQPAAGAYLNTTTPQIQLTYNRSVTVATSTLLVLINGVDRSSLFTK